MFCGENISCSFYATSVSRSSPLRAIPMPNGGQADAGTFSHLTLDLRALTGLIALFNNINNCSLGEHHKCQSGL